MRNGHGNDIYDFSRQIVADFSSNIPYRNRSAEIVAHLANHLPLIGNYPDPNARALTAQIATHHALSSDNILVTNGSAEAFYLLAHLFAEKRSTVLFPAFAEYEDACAVHKHRLSFMPLRELHPDSRFDSDTVWLGIPNNPDGFIVPYDTIQNICIHNPHTRFIVDNAYGELCPQSPPIVPLHQRCENLISVHSLTKTFAIPGLRIGYVVADKTTISQLKQLQTPWSVNALALEAGSFIMNHYEQLLPDSKRLCAESENFQQQLSRIENVEITPSHGNYFLARLRKGSTAQLKQYLIDNHGILIRNADNFRGLTPQHFRLSVQSEAHNRLLIEAVREMKSEK